MSQRIEDNAGSFGDLVYSPDLQTFDLSGNRGLLSTASSFIVGPIRLVIRVTTNLFMLPSHLVGTYANSLVITSAVFTILGAIDLLMFRKWPLIVSQVIPWVVAFKLKLLARVHKSDDPMPKHNIDIDVNALNNYCNQIEGELNAALGWQKEDINENQ